MKTKKLEILLSWTLLIIVFLPLWSLPAYAMLVAWATGAILSLLVLLQWRSSYQWLLAIGIISIASCYIIFRQEHLSDKTRFTIFMVICLITLLGANIINFQTGSHARQSPDQD